MAESEGSPVIKSIAFPRPHLCENRTWENLASNCQPIILLISSYSSYQVNYLTEVTVEVKKMEIVKNVYQVAGYPYGTHQNIYVIKGEDALMMVDTGIDESDLALVDENLTYWGLKDYPISHVLITNSHYDHCANAHILRKKGAKIVAGPSDAEGIESGDDRTASYAFTHKKKFIPCTVDLKIKDGDVIKSPGIKIEAIHVPGYTKGSMFYKFVTGGKILLFTGDVIKVFWAGNNLQSKLGWSGGVDYDRELYLETIKNKISVMPADILLPAHGELKYEGKLADTEGFIYSGEMYMEERTYYHSRQI